jgi:enamine deaminase RidA (YjgF/YER057c/UK114 family)
MPIEQRLHELNIELPEVAMPAANYVPYVCSGHLVFISGTLPMKDGKPQGIGKVGAGISEEQAAEVAHTCGINILAVLKKACDGDLSRVVQCVKLGIFVNATPEFTAHPKVANGVSDLMVAVFGKEIGSHARFAVGASGLPFGVAVEVDAVFEIENVQ